MKAVKLTGLSDIVAFTVAELRRLEILVARRYRKLNITLFVICEFVLPNNLKVYS
jgi:hypothetical protein